MFVSEFAVLELNLLLLLDEFLGRLLLQEYLLLRLGNLLFSFLNLQGGLLLVLLQQLNLGYKTEPDP